MSSAARKTRLSVVRGRQVVERIAVRGVMFLRVGRHLRSCYMQIDGTTVLGDECACRVDWPERTTNGFTFAIFYHYDCPIDEHKLRARAGSDAA